MSACFFRWSGLVEAADTADETNMQSECLGCKWISEEVDRLNHLITEYRKFGDYRFAHLAAKGIEVLMEDWRAHAHRDHESILTVTATDLACSRANALQG